MNKANDDITQAQRQWRSALLFPLRAVDLSDGEAGQAALRVVGGLFACSLYAVSHVSGAFGDLSKGLVAVALYTLFGYIWCVVVAMRLGTETLRLLLVIAMDELVLGVGLWLCGEQLAAIAWLPIFMSLGNGLRFGLRIALYSSFLAAAGMTLIFLLTPYWQQVRAASLGLIIASFVVPMYGVALARRLDRGRRAAEQRAIDAERANRIDSLTGAYNRAGFLRALRRTLDDAMEFQAPASLFYLDLDGFKPVNDQAGHLVGDAVLASVAKVLRETMRASDIVGRLGGDEFAVIARGLSNRQDAGNLANKLISAVGSVEVPQRPDLRVSVSVGICLMPDERLRTPEEAIEAADLSMLEVKRAGKGNFRIANGVE